ncbi:hypothetical protein BG418_30730 [Streptomyces sp. CBMA152]|nr:hypothetical protein [Streptomyces sp. CBMA152]
MSQQMRPELKVVDLLGLGGRAMVTTRNNRELPGCTGAEPETLDQPVLDQHLSREAVRSQPPVLSELRLTRHVQSVIPHTVGQFLDLAAEGRRALPGVVGSGEKPYEPTRVVLSSG